MSKRTASFSEDFLSHGTDHHHPATAAASRLKKIREKLFETFEATRLSVRDDVAVVNRDNFFLAMSNFIGSNFLFNCSF